MKEDYVNATKFQKILNYLDKQFWDNKTDKKHTIILP